MDMQKITHTTEETITFGEEIAKTLNGGDIVCLNGDLGAGKSTLAKGIALGLGIVKKITSPTFTLMNMYDVDDEKIKKLIHIDTYRLKNEEDLIDIGVEDFLGQPDTVCIIEWPEKIQNLLKNKKMFDITIKHLDHGREIIVK